MLKRITDVSMNFVPDGSTKAIESASDSDQTRTPIVGFSPGPVMTSFLTPPMEPTETSFPLNLLEVEVRNFLRQTRHQQSDSQPLSLLHNLAPMLWLANRIQRT